RDQGEPGHSGMPRSAVPLTNVAVLHLSSRISPDSPIFYALARQLSRQEILRDAIAQTTAVFSQLPYSHRSSGARASVRQRVRPGRQVRQPGPDDTPAAARSQTGPLARLEDGHMGRAMALVGGVSASPSEGAPRAATGGS